MNLKFPPPPQEEMSGAPPGPDSIWAPGYYLYYPKTGYQWTEGEWQIAKPGSHWIAPHWEAIRSKWLFVPGNWQAD